MAGGERHDQKRKVSCCPACHQRTHTPKVHTHTRTHLDRSGEKGGEETLDGGGVDAGVLEPQVAEVGQLAERAAKADADLLGDGVGREVEHLEVNRRLQAAHQRVKVEAAVFQLEAGNRRVDPLDPVRERVGTGRPEMIARQIQRRHRLPS